MNNLYRYYSTCTVFHVLQVHVCAELYEYSVILNIIQIYTVLNIEYRPIYIYIDCIEHRSYPVQRCDMLQVSLGTAFL